MACSTLRWPHGSHAIQKSWVVSSFSHQGCRQVDPDRLIGKEDWRYQRKSEIQRALLSLLSNCAPRCIIVHVFRRVPHAGKLASLRPIGPPECRAAEQPPHSCNASTFIVVPIKCPYYLHLLLLGTRGGVVCDKGRGSLTRQGP